jgi:hypothetical protein
MSGKRLPGGGITTKLAKNRFSRAYPCGATGRKKPSGSASRIKALAGEVEYSG